MSTRLIILAAGKGTRLRPLTNDRPKCMVELAGRSLIERQIDVAKQSGISDIYIVGGYLSEKLEGLGVTVLKNERYDTTNMVSTLMCAKEILSDDFVLSYGDIVYHPKVMQGLLREEASSCVVVDEEWASYWSQRFETPLSDAESLKIDPQGFLTSIGQDVDNINDIEAQYIGLMRFKGTGIVDLLDVYESARTSFEKIGSFFNFKTDLDNMYMTDLLQGMIDNGKQLKAHKIHRKWFEVDSVTDLNLAEKFHLDVLD
ncbi:NTP transferase domain-containing protein [Kiloniella majae]|uniref:phosphocholine cytidylyltransferase family protein n=1 Tax=Kiloniella majae TaxID=1938558 RepID=UPI0015C5107A|nr:phosphocholine cytidylyltransferase family protein [Kiloniella majae]